MKKAKDSNMFPKNSETIKKLPIFIGLSEEVANAGGINFTAHSLHYDNPTFFVCIRFYKPISTVFF